MATAFEAPAVSASTTAMTARFDNDILKSNGVSNIVHGNDASKRPASSRANERPSPPAQAAAPMTASAPPAAPLQPPPVIRNQAQPPPPLPSYQLPSQLPPISSITHGIPRQPALTLGKVAIVEPPKANIRRPASFTTQSYASPTRDHAQENPKFNEDVSRLTHGTQQSLPEAVRRVIRDHWEKTLLGTEFHQAFVMNAVIHHANGSIIRRSIRDFGHKMVSESKHELLDHFTRKDLDEVAEAILEKASDGFLDRALEKRLASIDARSLINALARAERLGYENNDNLDADNGKSQPAGPQLPSPASLPYPSQQLPSQAPQLHHQSSPVPQRAQIPNLQCPLCWRKFPTASPYEYHVKKQLCTKDPPSNDGFPFSCAHCGAGFITSVGQQYHLANKVCGDHGTAPATPKPAIPASGSPKALSSATISPSLPAAVLQPPSVPSQAPSRPATHQVSSYPPSPPNYQQYHTPSSNPRGTPSSGPIANNPYAHLSPDQRASLDEDLRQAEIQFAPRFKAAEAIPDEAERRLKLEGIQNSFSTKQSIIRKKYGVRLRLRRSRAEIEAERLRMHGHASAPGSKRRRTDNGSGAMPAYTQQPESAAYESPQHLSVSDVNASGLNGSAATAALSDPTASASQETPSRPGPPRNSLSSYQKNGYRVNTHVPHSTSAQHSPRDPASAGSSTTAEHTTKTLSPSSGQKRSGSAAEPVVLPDSDSSDSDLDAEIPATLPRGRRASGTPLKGLVG